MRVSLWEGLEITTIVLGIILGPILSRRPIRVSCTLDDKMVCGRGGAGGVRLWVRKKEKRDATIGRIAWTFEWVLEGWGDDDCG